MIDFTVERHIMRPVTEVTLKSVSRAGVCQESDRVGR